MTQLAPNKAPGIFISYRRDDSAGHAGRLYDRLCDRFGTEQIFMDIDHIDPGEDFVQVIQDAICACDVLLVVIGRQWAIDADGQTRRIDNPNDFVRLEITTALKHNVRVIPVLVKGANAPSPKDLPEEIAKLARLNALDVSDLRWKTDVDRLIELVEKVAVMPPDTLDTNISLVEETARRRQRAIKRAERLRAAAGQRGAQTGPLTRVVQTEPRAQDKSFKRKLLWGAAALVVALGLTLGAYMWRSRAAMKPPITNRVGMEFVWIPPGKFMMGSDEGDVDEQPVHQVTIKDGFYMGKYEVTQAQWEKVMGHNPANFKGANLPVENVSWDEAVAFINELNDRDDGYEYRLPSEAEWEYAARAGMSGDDTGNLDATAWYEKNSGDQTHPVGQKQPNKFGLYDMHGNVWEWIQDFYHDSYAGAPTNGRAWRPKNGGRRATSSNQTDSEQNLHLRRGGAYDESHSLNSSVRMSVDPQHSNRPDIGFRLVATPAKSDEP